MKNPNDIRAEAASAEAEARGIVNSAREATRDLTPEESARFDELTTRSDNLLREAEEVEARETRLNNLESRLSSRPAPSTPTGPHNDPRNTRGGRHGYSLLKAMRQSDPTNKGERLDGIELEYHQEASKSHPRAPQGLLVPWDLPVDLEASERARAAFGLERRDLDTTTGTGAKQTIISTSMIELLRNRMLVRSLGARVLSGLVGTFTLPRQSGGGSAYWVAEGSAPTASNQTIDSVPFTPKTLGARTLITRKFMMQVSMDAEMFVREDLSTIVALELDRVAINGSGSGAEPQGILQKSGATTVALGTNGLAPTWDSVVVLEENVSVANADIANLAYLTNAKFRSKAKRTVKVAGQPVYLIDDDGRMNSYPVAVSNQVPANLTKGTSNGICSAVIFGNWSEAMYGLWSGLDLVLDPYTAASSGGVWVNLMQDADFQVRHDNSFSKIVDALTT